MLRLLSAAAAGPAQIFPSLSSAATRRCLWSTPNPPAGPLDARRLLCAGRRGFDKGQSQGALAALLGAAGPLQPLPDRAVTFLPPYRSTLVQGMKDTFRLFLKLASLLWEFHAANSVKLIRMRVRYPQLRVCFHGVSAGGGGDFAGSAAAAQPPREPA